MHYVNEEMTLNKAAWKKRVHAEEVALSRAAQKKRVRVADFEKIWDKGFVVVVTFYHNYWTLYGSGTPVFGDTGFRCEHHTIFKFVGKRFPYSRVVKNVLDTVSHIIF